MCLVGAQLGTWASGWTSLVQDRDKGLFYAFHQLQRFWRIAQVPNSGGEGRVGVAGWSWGCYIIYNLLDQKSFVADQLVTSHKNIKPKPTIRTSVTSFSHIGQILKMGHTYQPYQPNQPKFGQKTDKFGCLSEKKKKKTIMLIFISQPRPRLINFTFQPKLVTM